MKTFIPIIFPLLLVSCNTKTEVPLQWYENQIIEQVIPETDSTYNIQIGIRAQAFRLDKKNDHFTNNLQLLKESLEKRKKVTIGVEKGTARIIRVKE